jgi:hypothetical protein
MRFADGNAHAPSPASHSELRMHPVACAYREHTALPANFPVGKVLVQLFLPIDAVVAGNLIGKRQPTQSVAAARAALAPMGQEQRALLASVMATANLKVLLATPQAQALYSAVCDKCGAEWARQHVSAPQLATWLATAHGASQLAPDADARVGKAMAQYLASAPATPTDVLTELYLGV